ncbi:hypothetical protein VMUT_2001 [Vulcanisaeta moutnovskia 768-28]|uniref:Uncharacterized protein n=1 Tax=Vulcanisaeta moutnovskia (strain 768-28) TaxID=985053 RepID=F0QWA5_VULM7|nr:hypothetical protein [Vulcanisaeta moutnovskia]ADY02200.1 hypothetical protein VMUT_2001 [Vulcanisaeta moutnovskia 768-28]
MSSSSDAGRLGLIYNGVSEIFNGYIAGIIVGVLLVVFLLAMLFSVIYSIQSSPFGVSNGSAVVSAIHDIGYFIISAVVIGGILLYRFFYRGFTYLARADSERYGIGRLGVFLSFVMLGVGFGIGLWFVLASISVGMLTVLDVLVGLAGLMPLVLTSIAPYRLGDGFGIND